MWRNLPIVIRRSTRQKTGYAFKASQKTERGFDIKGARQYEIGDSPRSVSRLHLARLDDAIVLEKQPDRSATVLVLLDVSGSEQLGSRILKQSANLELVRGLGEACLSRHCSLVICAFAETIVYESARIHDANTLENALDELEECDSKEKKTDPHDALDRAWELATSKSRPVDLVCIISDFLFTEPNTDTIASLQDVTDVIAFVVRDPIEETMPSVAGAFMICDSETGEMMYASGTDEYDPLSALERLGVETCVFATEYTEDDHYRTMADFFEMRRSEK